MSELQTMTIELRAEGDRPPTAIRLRRALKWLLRSHGLRCVAVSEVPATDCIRIFKTPENGRSVPAMTPAENNRQNRDTA